MLVRWAVWAVCVPACSSLAVGFGQPKKPPKAPKREAAKPVVSPPSLKDETAAAARARTATAARTLVSARGGFEASIRARADELAGKLSDGASGGVAVIDGLLGESAVAELRDEAAFVHAEFVAAAAGGTSGAGVGRTSAELLSPEDFARAPRVVALMLALAAELPAALGRPRGAQLSSDPSSNMLSCYVSGGAFPVHLDNHGGSDRRVIGLIYYLNPGYSEQYGGRFVPYRRRESGAGEALAATDLEPLQPIAPIGDRLIAFDADLLAHSVEAFNDDSYLRYALTVWLLADDADETTLRPDRQTLSPTDAHRDLANDLQTDSDRDTATVDSQRRRAQ